MAKKPVAIISFSHSIHPAGFPGNEIEMLLPVVQVAIRQSGLPRSQIGFTAGASSDFLAGQAFAFVRALDAVGAYPVIDDSHVDMDGAWALYEAWVRLQVGDIDSALVYAFGKPSQGRIHEIRPLELDPYYLAPLMPDPVSLAGLQRRAVLDAGLASESSLAGLDDYRPVDGAAALVLAAGDRALECGRAAAWISGIDHRIECHALGARDLTDSPSTRLAARAAGAESTPIDIAELHVQFAHEKVVLRRALNLDPGVTVNPSGSVLAQNPVMATGLIRIGEAAKGIMHGRGRRALAHATSGPCLQHNLVCLLEAQP